MFLCVFLLTLGRSGFEAAWWFIKNWTDDRKSIVLTGLSSLWWQGMDQSWPIYSQNICHRLWSVGLEDGGQQNLLPPSLSAAGSACRSHTLLWQMCSYEDSCRSSFSSCDGSAEACLNNQVWSFWLAHRTRLDYFPRPVRTHQPRQGDFRSFASLVCASVSYRHQTSGSTASSGCWWVLSEPSGSTIRTGSGLVSITILIFVWQM